MNNQLDNNTIELINFFKKLEKERAKALKIYLNFKDKNEEYRNASKKLKDINHIRTVKHKELLNMFDVSDNNFDEVYDSILDDDSIKLPIDYKAIVIDSYYSPIYQCYKTICKIIKPNGVYYFMSIPTTHKRLLGTIYN